MERTILLVYLTIFLFLFGENIQPGPRTEIYENIVCKNYYAELRSGIVPTQAIQLDDQRCKIAAVQEQLTLLTGIERLFGILPTILAIPFAALAAKYGRTLILTLALFGLLLGEIWPFTVCWFSSYLPIKLVWLQYAFNLIGGGTTVIVTLLHVTVADTVAQDVRTTVFFHMHAAGVVAAIIAYATASALMRVNAWVPWAVGLLSLLLSTATASLIPDSASKETAQGPVIEDFESRRDSTETWPGPVSVAPDEEQPGKWKRRLVASLESLRSIHTLVMGNSQLLLILLLVLICELGSNSLPALLIIYVSKRFHWSFSNANLLNSLEMGFELFSLVVLLPWLGRFLERRQMSAFWKDLHLAKASVAVLAIGAPLIGVTPVVPITIVGIMFMAFGTGSGSVLRSLATDMVDPASVSVVYSAITMLHVIGGSLSGPTYTGLYAAGLHAGENWLGLPFLAAGGMFCVAYAMLLFVKERPRYQVVQDGEGL